MKYFTIEEFLRSDTASSKGIDNTPTSLHLSNIHETIGMFLDPMREAWADYCLKNNLGAPGLRVSSGYRSEALNKVIGGSATSAHAVGFAADIVPINGRMTAFVRFVKEWIAGRVFDQIIWEKPVNGIPAWVHFGWKNRAGEQRGQIFTQ